MTRTKAQHCASRVTALAPNQFACHISGQMQKASWTGPRTSQALA